MLTLRSRTMTLDEFKALSSPEKLSRPLQALWHDAHGDWDRAHELAQQAGGAEGDWVHAYLHRKEGDDGNARYWYFRAGQVKPNGPFQDEWAEIAAALLGK
jgi:hypothetical protein